MRRFSIVRLCLFFLVAAGLYALVRHAQADGDARLLAADAWSRARAQAVIEEWGERHGWPSAGETGHWLATRGRRLVTDQGRRWRGIGASYVQDQAVPSQATFLRLSAAPFFADDGATEPARLAALAALVDRLSDGGRRYVLVGVPESDGPAWQERMATLVHALSDRPHVLFDGTSCVPTPLEASDGAARPEWLDAGARIGWIRQQERAVDAPAHVIAIDPASAAPAAHGHHVDELDYAPLELPVPCANVVTLGRRPAYALRGANAWFVEPLRAREPAVRGPSY